MAFEALTLEDELRDVRRAMSGTAQSGEGIPVLKIVRAGLKIAGPILKELGPVALKKLLIPLAKRIAKKIKEKRKGKVREVKEVEEEVKKELKKEIKKVEEVVKKGGKLLTPLARSIARKIKKKRGGRIKLAGEGRKKNKPYKDKNGRWRLNGRFVKAPKKK